MPLYVVKNQFYRNPSLKVIHIFSKPPQKFLQKVMYGLSWAQIGAMRNDWNRLNALPLTSRSSNITALDKLFVWVAAELATHTHACNTYRIPKWARHLESISISLIPHPATHLVAETRIAPWQTLPLLHLSLPPPFLQIGRRRKNVKKLICHPRGSFVQIRGTSWACEEKEHQFSQSQHSQRKSDKIQEQQILNWAGKEIHKNTE